IEDSANLARTAVWRTAVEVPAALRDAFWTEQGRGVCMICRVEKSPFAGPIAVLYTPEFDGFPASIPALVCADCRAGADDRAVAGAIWAVAGTALGWSAAEIADRAAGAGTPVWLSQGGAPPPPPAAASAPRRRWWRFGK